ncbi:MAG: PPOX class F420-dependent oxidoreductase [Ktedonobacteraceae bacterium]|nr:PPOX class F420-dependent oxidoreductase [Ktedonobacteraceae bacterium]MBO0793161.1 PPOX class F420-dependent oxidoreductase [Ktedonobacteraceae bacterium]
MSVELSDRVKDFLREKRFPVLATINKDGSPQLSAMWYQLLDDGTIMMNTKAGRVKERNMRRDPRISLCFEEGGYLTLSGTVELIDDPEVGQRDIYRLALRYDGEEQARKQVEAQFSKERRVTVIMTIEKVIEALR